MGRDRLLIGFTSSLNDVSHMGLTKKIVVDHHFSYKHCHFEQADSGRPLFSDAPTSCLSYPMVLGISVLNFSNLWRCHRFSRGAAQFFHLVHGLYVYIHTICIIYIILYIYIWILFCPPPISPYLEWFFHFFSDPHRDHLTVIMAPRLEHPSRAYFFWYIPVVHGCSSPVKFALWSSEIMNTICRWFSHSNINF